MSFGSAYSKRKVIAILIFNVLSLFFFGLTCHSATDLLVGVVVHVVDGDTITVLDTDKNQHRVRVAGIDAPEKGQPFGNASKKTLAYMVANKDVRVEFQKYDRYGRIVGKVSVAPPDCPTCAKTIDVGLAQVTSGMAWWYRRYAHEQTPDDQKLYEVAEQEARAKKTGLWQDKNPLPPWEYRRASRER